MTSAVFVTNATADDGKGKKARKKSKKSKKSKKKKDENEEMEDDENENEDEDDNDIMVKKSEDAIASSNFTNVALVTTSKDGFAKVWDLIAKGVVKRCPVLEASVGRPRIANTWSWTRIAVTIVLIIATTRQNMASLP